MPPSETIPGALPGALIADKYRVERILGRGGMGIVVAARHVELNQELAIKVLLPSANANPEAAARFLREGRAAARLTSPHVAKVYDTGRLATGEPYLVMEFLRGSDLKQIIERVGPVPIDRAVAWVLEAADALAEAHSLGIVHRDVKPSNIFLSETASGTHVKVLDFGISKQREAGDADLTGTAVSMGTPRYMAPEQMRSARQADARADIWSLGAVLYELTTGKAPFTGDSMTEVIVEVLQTDPTLPSIANPAVTPALEAVIKKCLEKSPEHRFLSMQAFIAALRAAVAPQGQAAGFAAQPSRGVSLAATVVETPTAPRPFSESQIPTNQRPWSPQPAGASPGVAGPGAPPPPAPSAPGADGTMHPWNVPDGKPNRPSGLGGILFAGAALVMMAIGGAGGYVLLRGRSAPTGSAPSDPARAPETTSTARAAAAPSIPAQPPESATAASLGPSAQPSATAPAASAPLARAPAPVAPPTPQQPPTLPPAAQPQPPPPQPPPPQPPPAAAANCNPPFTIDASGMRHAKPECL